MHSFFMHSFFMHSFLCILFYAFILKSIRKLQFLNSHLLLSLPSHLFVLRGRAMDSVLFHPLVLMNVLWPETVIFPENHTYAQQQYSCSHQPNYNYYRTHTYSANGCILIQNSVQRYNKKLTYASAHEHFYLKSIFFRKKRKILNSIFWISN